MTCPGGTWASSRSRKATNTVGGRLGVTRPRTVPVCTLRPAVRQRVGDALTATAKAHLAPLFAEHPLGMTLQIDEGAEVFDPMGDGRARSDKVMLPEKMMSNPAELRRWIARAFNAAAKLPKKAPKQAKKAAKATAPKKR